MLIVVNGERVDIRSENLANLLDELGYGAVVVATAVNRKFAPAPRRTEITLKDGDRIEILAPMQGG